MDEFKKYDLSENELVKITRLCVQEQGRKGAPYEASLMCNLYELNGKNYSSLYDYVRNSGWFSKASEFMDHGEASSSEISAVREVICKGHRLFPRYIDEHDCFRDIKWAKNSGKDIDIHDRGQYIPNVTVIQNKWGSRYTFYSFPTSSSDPFGYTNNKYAPDIGTDRLIMCIGDSVNFRKGAATSFDVIEQLNQGDTLIQKSVSGAWIKAEHNNVIGYIYSKYVLDVEQTAAVIVSNLRSTYSPSELKVLLKAAEKLVN